MADSSNGNTTSLNLSGTLGTRNYRDRTMRDLSNRISRTNISVVAKSDARVKALRDIIFRYVEGLALEDKINIITEYGDLALLRGSTSESKLNEVCTMTIMSNMSPEDLEQLKSDIILKGKNLKKHLKDAERDKKNKNKQGSKAITADLVEEDTTPQRRDVRRESLHNNIPKKVRNQLPQLRRELQRVLRQCFDRFEIVAIAQEMGIDFDGSTKPKDLEELIINRTILYAVLVLHRDRGLESYMNMVSNAEAYENLIQYTSYSYITGRAGIDPREWKIKQDEARRAKLAIEERSRIRSMRRRGNARGIESITGGATANTLRGLARKLRNNDNGILAEASYDDLIELASKYGINPTSFKNRNVNRLKAEIYAGMANESNRVRKLSSGRMTQRKNDLIKINESHGYQAVLGSAGSAAAESLAVPLVHFDRDGNLEEMMIDSAVPVYIVSQGASGKSGRTGLQNRYGVTRKSARAGALGNKSVTSREELDERERFYLDCIIEQPAPTSSNVPGLMTAENVHSPADLEAYLRQEAHIDTWNAIGAYLSLNRQENDVSRHAAWLYVFAVLNHYKKLANYLIYRYGTNIRPVKRKGGKAKRFLKASARGSFVGSIVTSLIGLKQNLRQSKNAMVPSDLPPEARNIYNEQFKDLIDSNNAQGFETLLVQKYHYTTNAFKEFKAALKNIDPKNYENTYLLSLARLLASSMGQKMISNMFNNQIVGSSDVNYRDAYETLRKSGGKGARFWNLVGLRTFRNNLRNTLHVGELSSPGGFNGIDILKDAETPRPVPVLKLNADNKTLLDNYEELTHAVPVYVVNLLSSSGANEEEILKESASDPVSKKALKRGKGGPGKTIASGMRAIPNSHQWLRGGTTKSGKPKKLFRGVTGTLVQPVFVANKEETLELNNDLINPLLPDKLNRNLFNNYISPVFVVNRDLRDVTSKIPAIYSTLNSIDGHILNLMTGLTTEVVSAPMGVGAITRPLLATSAILETIQKVGAEAIQTTTSSLLEGMGIKMATGGTVTRKSKPITRFATGGSQIITGDAKGANMFSGGAKPELVSSTGDMSITPLNRSGRENKEVVRRLTTSDAAKALATSLSSHVVKFNYKLPNGVSEVTSVGEAIKVFNVKPGIDDIISINGTETSLAELVASISTQVNGLLETSAAQTQTMAALASAISNLQTSKGGNSQPTSVAVPSGLETILGGR